jgi:hypothetical protein
MIKVICIENVGVSLTNHKVYDAELTELFKCDGYSYRIKNDDGNLAQYNSVRFITLAEWREKQIKIVLDD